MATRHCHQLYLVLYQSVAIYFQAQYLSTLLKIHEQNKELVVQFPQNFSVEKTFHLSPDCRLCMKRERQNISRVPESKQTRHFAEDITVLRERARYYMNSGISYIS